MSQQANPLSEVADALAGFSDAFAEFSGQLDVRRLGDEDLLETVRDLEEVGRRVDALRVATAGEIAERSRKELGTDGLAAKKGCRNGNELLQRLTQVSSVAAEKRIRLGGHTRQHLTLIGDDLPARFPRVAAAMADGSLGVDSAEAIVRGLTPAFYHGALDDFAAAESELVAAATGTGPDTPVPFAADEVRVQAQLWSAVIDPDGTLTAEEKALTRRGLKLGREREGLVPLTGSLLPEIAAKLTRLLDTCLSPVTGPRFLESMQEESAPSGQTGDDGQVEDDHAAGAESDSADADSADPAREYADTRNRDQQRHDGFAALIDVIARSGDTPIIGGAAPTVLVTVRAEDLASGHGVGHIDGSDTPISMRAVKQFTCTGGTQTVTLDHNGRITALGSPQRCFTPAQRKAIMARDGGCIIPGCSIPAGWTEIHHVTPAARQGETHTDNGTSL